MQAHLKNRRFLAGLAKSLRIFRFVIIRFIGLSFVWVLAYRFINPPFTILMLQRKQEARSIGNRLSIKQEWVAYEEISQPLKNAIVVAEDRIFLQHNGFDWNSIRLASKRNGELGKNVYGASTISQQTARNVFLWQGKSWLRKGLEAYFTVLIELLWSKKRILEVYFNVIEYGSGVFGIESASNIYFGMSARSVLLDDACLIACILPNPRQLSVTNPSRDTLKKSKTIKWRVKEFASLVEGL